MFLCCFFLFYGSEAVLLSRLHLSLKPLNSKNIWHNTLPPFSIHLKIIILILVNDVHKEIVNFFYNCYQFVAFYVTFQEAGRMTLNDHQTEAATGLPSTQPFDSPHFGCAA